MLDEPRYLRLAHDVFRQLVDGFESIDIDDADLDVAGDVVTIAFATGRKCIVNTQRPVRQIWLAGGQRAWHFSWDEATGRWLDDKGTVEKEEHAAVVTTYGGGKNADRTLAVVRELAAGFRVATIRACL